MRGKNRSRSTISQLPPEVRDVVHEMVKATNTCTLSDIQKYLASLDVTLSLQAISTYSKKLLASLEDIRVTNERMNAMVREAAKYPELDFSEVINRVAGQKILDAILSKPDEEWNDIALDKLLREMNAQTKAVAYARRLDIQSKDDTQAAVGELKAEFFSALGTEHPEKPYELSNIKLGDYQFAKQKEWEASGQIALCGSGVEPGMADVFAKYAEKHLFDKIDEVNVRDGDNYGNTDSDFGFSVWTTIEECLQPPVIWEKNEEYPQGHWFCTENFSEPEIFNFPGGIGDVEVINVEHEEVVLVPREIDCNRCTFKYGVPADFRKKLLVLKEYGLSDKRTKIKVGDSEITPRDFVCKVIPSPVDATMTMTGKGCAGTWVTGWKDGKYRSVYLYQVADNQE